MNLAVINCSSGDVLPGVGRDRQTAGSSDEKAPAVSLNRRRCLPCCIQLFTCIDSCPVVRPWYGKCWVDRLQVNSHRGRSHMYTSTWGRNARKPKVNHVLPPQSLDLHRGTYAIVSRAAPCPIHVPALFINRQHCGSKS